MNKKLIAIAVASVMAAPVAMADMKMSGRVGLDFTSKSTDGATNDPRGLSDSGTTRLQFDGTAGQAYARIALDERLGRDDVTIDTSGAEADISTFDKTKRDVYLGYKFDNGMAVQAGRMGGALKNLEKDKYIGTFLETRSTVANSYTSSRYGSSSFVDDVFQLTTKAGGAKVKIQYGASENTDTNNGHIAVGVSGKAGAVDYWVGYNNGAADGDSLSPPYASQSNIKVGGKMKFGTITASLNYTSMDKDGAVGAGNATDSISLGADFNLGGGLSADFTYATRSGDVAADDSEFYRLGVMKKINKSASAYAGYTSTDNDAAGSADSDEVGFGMIVKF